MLGWLKKDDVIPEIITSGEEGRWRAISKRLAALSRLPSTEIDLKHFSGKAQCGCFSYKLSQMSRTPRADSRHFPQIARPERAGARVGDSLSAIFQFSHFETLPLILHLLPHLTGGRSLRCTNALATEKTPHASLTLMEKVLGFDDSVSSHSPPLFFDTIRII